MPAKSIAQQHLFGAAEHGATFPAAEKLRDSMSHSKLHDFAAGPMTGKPEHAVATGGAPNLPSAPAPQPSVPEFMPGLLKGSEPSIVGSNTNTLRQGGQNEFEATRLAIGLSNQGKPKKLRHGNLGKFLHPRKDGKPHGSDSF